MHFDRIFNEKKTTTQTTNTIIKSKDTCNKIADNEAQIIDPV